VGVYLRLRRKLYTSRRFLRWVTWTTPVGVVAIIGGWIVAEAGRQPWVVYGQLATGAAVSHLSLGSLLFSFIGFVLLYVVMLTLWIVYVVRQLRRGPDPIETIELPPSQSPRSEPAADDVPVSGAVTSSSGVRR
jgi:cytochrome d ubiquinol oxidase subunit I